MRKNASPTKTTKHLNDILSCELRVPKDFLGRTIDTNVSANLSIFKF